MTNQVDSTGMELDVFADILAWAIADTEEKFGDSVNTDKDQWIGHLLRIVSTLTGGNNDAIQTVYDALSVKNSEGVLLDNLVALIGLERQALTFSTATLTLTATGATTVPIGTQYSTAAGVIFATTVVQVFTGAGTASVASRCTVGGKKEAGVGEINQIVNAVAGITAVTNPAIAVAGDERETDSELKEAHTIATATAGKNDIGSVFEAIRKVTGNSAAYVNENKESYAVDGLPGNRIHAAAIGGSSEDLAVAIENNRTGSLKTYGATSVEVYDEITSHSSTVYLNLAANVPIYIFLSVVTVPGLFPDDGEQQFLDNFVAHFKNFRIKQTVIYDALWGSVYAVEGITSAVLKIGTAPGPTGITDLTMTVLQKADLTAENASTQVSVSIA